jgi:hypothetical protein
MAQGQAAGKKVIVRPSPRRPGRHPAAAGLMGMADRAATGTNAVEPRTGGTIVRAQPIPNLFSKDGAKTPDMQGRPATASALLTI